MGVDQGDGQLLGSDPVRGPGSGVGSSMDILYLTSIGAGRKYPGIDLCYVYEVERGGVP